MHWLRGLGICLFTIGCRTAASPTATKPDPRDTTVEIPADPDKADKPSIIFGAEFANVPDSGKAVWIAYAMDKLLTHQKGPRPPHNPTADDYDIELSARQSMVKVLKELKAEDPNATLNDYLELMQRLEDEGYLDEYVVVFTSRPGWTIPKTAIAAFDLEGFFQTHPELLSGHRPITGAGVRVPGAPPRAPDPNEGLPDPSDFDPRRRPCHESQADLDEAAAAWANIATRLTARPLSVENRSVFLNRLLHLKDVNDPQDIIWVNGRAAQLVFLAGFCAVEAKDWSKADRHLQAATALDPFWVTPQQEWVLVLTKLEKYEEALTLVDALISSVEDPCQLAGAWRRRGYLLIELGALKQARRAYETSLEYHPKHPVALRELEVIRIELERLSQNGSSDAEDASTRYRPPPTAERLQVTTCPNGG